MRKRIESYQGPINYETGEGVSAEAWSVQFILSEDWVNLRGNMQSHNFAGIHGWMPVRKFADSLVEKGYHVDVYDEMNDYVWSPGD